MPGSSDAALMPKGEDVLPWDDPDINEQTKAKVRMKNHADESDGAKVFFCRRSPGCCKLLKLCVLG
jgi:predicted ATPase